jgi:hypothetical protein
MQKVHFYENQNLHKPREVLYFTYLFEAPTARLELTRIASQNAMHKQFLAIQFTFCIAAGCDAKLALYKKIYYIFLLSI